MATRVLLTIDTELVWSHYVAGHDWRENYARSVEPAGVGLGYQLARLAEHGLKAVFFVDPMPALLYGIEPVQRMVGTVLAAGQEVQLHIHPAWHRVVASGKPRPRKGFELNTYDAEMQKVLIVQARDLLVAAGAPDPIAFRAGSYAASDDTLRVLAELGFTYDSSHNGHEDRSSDSISLPRREMAPVAHCGVIEVPVSLVWQPDGSLRHLQLCAVSLREMGQAIDHAIEMAHPVTTLVSHSFELARRDGLAPNRVAVRRFEGLCTLLAERAAEAPTAHFTDLGPLPLVEGARPHMVNGMTQVTRMAEQVWATLVEERTP